MVVMWKKERLKQAEKRFEALKKGDGTLREFPNSDQDRAETPWPVNRDIDIRIHSLYRKNMYLISSSLL